MAHIQVGNPSHATRTHNSLNSNSMASVSPETLVETRRRRRERYHEADVVIVGAGVLGCAVAYAMANQGRSVLLLERWMHEPDRIVGELMQPGGVASLQKLGLGECIEDIDSVPCHGYHVVFNGDSVVLPYPPVDGKGNIAMDAYVGANGRDLASAASAKKSDDDVPKGCSFHHGRFIMQLRRKCLAHPNITVVETEVTGLVRGGPDPDEVLGVQTKTAVRPDGDSDTYTKPSISTTTEGENAKEQEQEERKGPAVQKKDDVYFGQLTIVADGYASRFRADVLGSAPMIKSKFYALELIDCPLQPEQFGHVFINSSAFPVLLYQIGTHETRALIDVPIGLPAASPANGGVRGYIRNVIIPSLPTCVHASVEAALADGKIPRSMPNSWLPPAPRSALTKAARNGVVLLGDAYNMRHPLTGGGMTVALNDALVLTDLLAPDNVPDLGDHAAIARAMGKFHWMRKRLTSIINVLAQALYALFAADRRPERVLQQGCFAYFVRGWAAQPVGLLGGIIRQPLVLAYHFFSVAFMAICINSVQVMTGRGAPAPAPGSPPSSSLSPIGYVVALARLPLAIADGILVLWTACIVFLPVFWRELK